MQPINLPTLTKILIATWQTQNTDIKTFEHVRIENPPYMPLVIENIGTLEGFPIISVAHYYEQNGDLMKDPEMTFQFFEDHLIQNRPYHWRPLTFEMSAPPIYQIAVITSEGKRTAYYPKLYRDLSHFARQWDRNLHSQNFVL